MNSQSSASSGSRIFSGSVSGGSVSSVLGRRRVHAVCMLGVVAALGALFGCGGDDTDCPQGIIVNLKGAAQGNSCSANAFYRHDAQAVNISCVVSGPDCTCHATVPPGEYEVTAQRGTTVIYTGGVVVEEGACAERVDVST